MRLCELEQIIKSAGGGRNSLESAALLIRKINRLEEVGKYKGLLRQLRSAKEQGDLRGRVLEVNFVHAFVECGVDLTYGAKQGRGGDVDVCWNLSGVRIFIELKLLGQDQGTRRTVEKRNKECGGSVASIKDDTCDVGRIQRDIFEKASVKKFSPMPEVSWVNLVAIDVSELQLGTVDIGDCLLATLGDTGAAVHMHSLCRRPSVVGVFELATPNELTCEKVGWIRKWHPFLEGNHHPRNFIHGVLFLFRQPTERAALCYRMCGKIVWNPFLMDTKRACDVNNALHAILGSD